MTTPTVHAMADQTMAAIDEAQRLAPDNGQLHQDPRLADLIHAAMAWAPRYSETLPARSRLIMAHRLSTDLALNTFDFGAHAPCSMCHAVEYDEHHSLRPTQRLHVNAGATNIEFAFCEACAAHLESTYGEPRYSPGLVWLR